MALEQAQAAAVHALLGALSVLKWPETVIFAQKAATRQLSVLLIAWIAAPGDISKENKWHFVTLVQRDIGLNLAPVAVRCAPKATGTGATMKQWQPSLR
jgi:hypothetical protein